MIRRTNRTSRRSRAPSKNSLAPLPKNPAIIVPKSGTPTSFFPQLFLNIERFLRSGQTCPKGNGLVRETDLRRCEGTLIGIPGIFRIAIDSQAALSGFPLNVIAWNKCRDPHCANFRVPARSDHGKPGPSPDRDMATRCIVPARGQRRPFDVSPVAAIHHWNPTPAFRRIAEEVHWRCQTNWIGPIEASIEGSQAASWRHSARAAVRCCLKTSRRVRWRWWLKWLWIEAWTAANFCRVLMSLNRAIAPSRLRNG